MPPDVGANGHGGRGGDREIAVAGQGGQALVGEMDGVLVRGIPDDAHGGVGGVYGGVSGGEGYI